MALDPNFTGSVINALPIDKMIGGPLQAMITAQVQASKSYADFLLGVCIKDGKALQIQFEYDETQTDTEGNYRGMVKKAIRIPLLAAVTHPNICIEEGTVDFELEVTASEASNTATGVEVGFEGKLGWGPVSLSVSGKVSHKSEQTRKQDTRAKYSFHCAIKRQEPPEAIMRVIDFLTDAATKPVIVPGQPKPEEAPTALPQSSLVPDPAVEEGGTAKKAGAPKETGAPKQTGTPKETGTSKETETTGEK
jgi:hypothetical protein